MACGHPLGDENQCLSRCNYRMLSRDGDGAVTARAFRSLAAKAFEKVRFRSTSSVTVAAQNGGRCFQNNADKHLLPVATLGNETHR